MHLVSPKLPTVLDHQTAVDLPGYDLWLHDVNNVHVLPGTIDLEKFKNALSDVLQLYPHAAGQLRCQDGRWFIELTNTPVPVDVNYVEEKSLSSVLQDDWVIQEDLASLVYSPVDASPINGTAPLLRFKLTFFMGETCVGISWHHTLGDAIALFRFTHTLSQYYQSKVSEFPAPTFRKHVFPPPSEAIAAEYHAKIRQLHDAYPFAELGAIYAEASRGIENLQWRCSGEELRRLHAKISSSRPPTLTIQDCLTAYLVTVLNRCQEKPIQMVTNVGSYRNMNAPFVEANVAGNAIQNIVAEQLPSDLIGIATAIRTSIIRSRDAQDLENWLSTASDCMLSTINSGKSFFFRAYDEVLTVNSNSSIDWCSANFGFPDGSKFHTSGFTKFYFRPFKSNPVKGVDGIWHARQDSVDISMGVPTELKSRMLDILTRDIEQSDDLKDASPRWNCLGLLRFLPFKWLFRYFELSNTG